MLAHRVLSFAMQAGPAVIIWGFPGIGKSATFTAMAKAWDEPIEIITASNRDPSDFGGLPVRTEDGVAFEPMAWAKRLHKAGKGIFLADEMSCAPIACQHALLRVILDRQVGDLTLPKKIRLAAAANPADIANGWELTAPMANRFIHLYWTVGGDYLEFWEKGLIEGWNSIMDFPKAQENWEQAFLPNARVMVSSYIRSNPSALFAFPKDESKRGGPWASPRTWDFVCRVLAVSWKESTDVQFPLIAGCIGDGHTAAFMTWKEKLDLPNPMDLLNDPESFKVPKEPDRLYVILHSVVTTAISNPSLKTWSAAWQIILSAIHKTAKDIPTAAVLVLVNSDVFFDESKYHLPPDAVNIFSEIFTKVLDARKAREARNTDEASGR